MAGAAVRTCSANRCSGCSSPLRSVTATYSAVPICLAWARAASSGCSNPPSSKSSETRRWSRRSSDNRDSGDSDDYYLRYGTYGPGYYYRGRPGNPNLYRGYYRENNSLYYKEPHRPLPPPGPGAKQLPAKPGRGPADADELKGAAPPTARPAPK